MWWWADRHPESGRGAAEVSSSLHLPGFPTRTFLKGKTRKEVGNCKGRELAIRPDAALDIALRKAPLRAENLHHEG